MAILFPTSHKVPARVLQLTMAIWARRPSRVGIAVAWGCCTLLSFDTRRHLGLLLCRGSKHGTSWKEVISGSSLPLIFCIHVRLGPIYWGGYLPCRKDYKVMVFYM
jgi:hypothetical protein